MMVYHGTKNAKNFNINDKYTTSGKKGRLEGGSGLYTVDSYYTASRFGKVIGLELELKENEDAKNVKIPLDNIFEFMSTFSKRQQSEFRELYEKMSDKSYDITTHIDAKLFQNMLLIANEGKFHLISQKVNDFLLENNVKYTVDRYDGNRMILIHDFGIIKRKLDPILIKDEDLKFEYAKESVNLLKEEVANKEKKPTPSRRLRI